MGVSLSRPSVQRRAVIDKRSRARFAAGVVARLVFDNRIPGATRGRRAAQIVWNGTTPFQCLPHFVREATRRIRALMPYAWLGWRPACGASLARRWER